MAMFATMLKRDRIRNGMTQAHVARRLGISLAQYRAVEAEEQAVTVDIYGKTVELFGWRRPTSRRAGGSPTGRVERPADPVDPFNCYRFTTRGRPSLAQAAS